MSGPGTVVTGLDLPALTRYFADHVRGTGAPLRASLLAGGKSNLTYLVTDGADRWVVRRPPLGPITPTAHDMGREYRVVKALHGNGVPVARPVALCEDADVIGAPFAVVSYVAGRTLQDGAAAAGLSRTEARDCSRTLVDTLADLHAVDFTEIGLGDFGRPRGYLERQVRRWRGQWSRVATRELGSLDRLHAGLTAALPAQAGEAVVHGDYRLDNTIVDAGDASTIKAVVDWEMAALGDPLADLGLLLVYWDPRTEPVLGVRHAPSANPGFLTADALAERYADRTGHALDHLTFYRALGYFKLAVIAEGIHQRHLAGRTVGDGFDTVGDAVPVLLDAGLEVLR